MDQHKSTDKLLSIKDYPFEKWDFSHYFKTVLKDRGYKAVYQFLNRPIRRTYSRSLIKKYAPQGFGLEIGVGARTIAPSERTVLSDAFSEHGIHASIAKVFFKGESIPYASETFDFLLSEHVLEHITNPIKILHEWIRVLKTGGVLFCFLPHKERTNDRFRQVTSLEHLVDDFNRNISANDSYHLSEWRKNVVEKGLMPPHYSHMNDQELLDSHSIHHHVWTEKEIVQLFTYLGLKILFVDEKVQDRRDSFVVVAQK